MYRNVRRLVIEQFAVGKLPIYIFIDDSPLKMVLFQFANCDNFPKEYSESWFMVPIDWSRSKAPDQINLSYHGHPWPILDTLSPW